MLAQESLDGDRARSYPLAILVRYEETTAAGGIGTDWNKIATGTKDNRKREQFSDLCRNCCSSSYCSGLIRRSSPAGNTNGKDIGQFRRNSGNSGRMTVTVNMCVNILAA